MQQGPPKHCFLTQHYMTSKPKRLGLEFSPPLKPQIPDIFGLFETHFGW